MELPHRAPGDELLTPGEMIHIRQRLRRLSPRQNLTTVIVNAFDHRTRMLPFLYADMTMPPAGVRAIGSAMLDAGFGKTRIVLQQWNRGFRPFQMRLDGRIPDLFMVSSLRIHAAACDALIRDACRIDLERRPLIISGGPRIIYEPWAVFGSDPQDPWGADVAVTGEEYVLLNLLETVLSIRAKMESMRSAFVRARNEGLLDAIPGLVYAKPDEKGRTEALVDTGIQRLVGDLDELPHPALGYRLLEPPSRLATLAADAVSADRLHSHSRAASLVMTAGCKFGCAFCPIPAYNQHQYRSKSAERIKDEIRRLYDEYHFFAFFGADDNFFNNRDRALEISETLAREVTAGSRAHCRAILGTEATIHDTLRMKDHLAVVRKAGIVALWLGVEDITASLVNKGQGNEKTLDAFRLLRGHGIFPNPMLIHHDTQPCYTRNNTCGLLNQVQVLRRAGAVNLQVLMLGPAPGSKVFESEYISGNVFQSVNGIPVEPRHLDGNYLVSSRHPRPWSRQLNLLMAYLYFYNPLRCILALVSPKSRIPFADVVTWPPPDVLSTLPLWDRIRARTEQKLKAYFLDFGLQLFGIWGLMHTFPRSLRWSLHLMRSKIKRHTQAPASSIPMCSPDGNEASHATPGTPRFHSMLKRDG